MSKLKLKPIDIKLDISPEEFRKQYLASNTPVVFKSFSANWSAPEKWNLEYFKEKYGNIIVPLYEEAFAESGGDYMGAQQKMRFADYLDLITSQPTKLRMFLFNIFKHAPELCNDFDYPEAFTPHFVKRFPFMFFGGKGSWVDSHFDADLSHVFITQFHGPKHLVLHKPELSPYLYRHPLTVSSNIDIGKPDFEKYPLLQDIEGYECTINHGETLFIPSGYWHYIDYLNGGWSLSLRARPDSLTRRLQGLANIFSLTVMDRSLTKLIGTKRWYQMKEQMALRKATKLRKA